MPLLINIDVDDLAAAEVFYGRALGLRAARRFGGDIVEMLGLDVPVYLLRKPAGTLPFPGAGVAREYRPHWTPVHLDLAVDDLDAALADATAAGATSEGGVVEGDWGRMALLRDPFGHGFCLVQFSELGYDALSTDREAMERR